MLRRALPLLRRGLSTKASTGIVGLPVEPRGREVLMQLSASILKAVAAFPETAHYRRVLEQVYSARLEACKAHTEVADIELAVGQGQIEELIEMARDEQKLIPKMAEWKPWEVPEGHTVTIVEDDESVIPPKATY